MPAPRLRGLLEAGLRARERESRRISRFLHDSVGQVLTATGLHLESLRLDLAGTEAADRILEIQQHLDGALGQVRTLSQELNPAFVERVGLPAALERLVARLQAGSTVALGLRVERADKLDPGLAKALYRIAELAVENAIQHSRAARIEIELDGSSLRVRDNGRGFAQPVAREGLGLPLMRFLAGEAGLKLTLESPVERGTIVFARPRL